MEEAQKRKERLKAMRIEADGATADANADRPGVLSNPFVESGSTSTSAPAQYSSPRFDFYTDPMAAFSGTRRDSITPQVPHGHPNMFPSNFYCLLYVFRDGFRINLAFPNEFMFAFGVEYCCSDTLGLVELMNSLNAGTNS